MIDHCRLARYEIGSSLILEVDQCGHCTAHFHDSSQVKPSASPCGWLFTGAFGIAFSLVWRSNRKRCGNSHSVVTCRRQGYSGPRNECNGIFSFLSRQVICSYLAGLSDGQFTCFECPKLNLGIPKYRASIENDIIGYLI